MSESPLTTIYPASSCSCQMSNLNCIFQPQLLKKTQYLCSASSCSSLCFRSRMNILLRAPTPTPLQSREETQRSGRKDRLSATVNPDSRDSLGLQDQRYISSHHCHFYSHPTLTGNKKAKVITLTGLMEALLFSVKV